MVRFVIDAAATVDLLLGGRRGGQVRQQLEAADDPVPLTVTHMDAEVLSALARLHRADELGVDDVAQRLELLADLEIERRPISGSLLQAAWELRHNVAAKDALYVAAAEGAGADLLTTDGRLARAVPHIAVPLGDGED